MDEIFIDKKQVEELFYYDQTSPTYLRYKKENNGTGKYKRFAGDIAGYVKAESRSKNNQPGYFSIKINRKSVAVHRVICVLHGFEITGKQIDHIDGNRQNNKIENLRVVTLTENSRNHKVRITNKTGIVGVCFKNTPTGGKYCATVRDFDKSIILKSFSVAKYGKEKAKEMASIWRKNMIERLNQMGAGYSEKHLHGTMDALEAKNGGK